MRGKLLVVVMFAVTTLMAGAWGQSSDYPQQPPSQDYPQAGQDNPSAQGPSGPGPDDQSAQRSEGPAPEVGRISLTHGDVTTQRGDTGDWGVTSVNAPVMAGDQVATGDQARTEIQLNSVNIVRLAARSQVKIADLSRSRIQLQVAQGYASYTMFNGSEADVEIDTPNVAVHLLRAGRYRVQVTSDDQTDVIVREGEAEITTPEGSTRVKEGDLITIRGAQNPEYRVASAPARDDWDQWNRDRDNVINSSQSVSRTNRYYTGVNDLDSNGRWVYVPGYGNVWQPYQEASWAPYQAGRWVWEPYYGWTWVSYEPWGWAPYHYGRWFFYSGSWCWWPGPVFVSYRPVWSPAFVFFVGFGHHSTFGFGSIGWFPVGPHDVFYPWYGRGFNRVNVVNVTNINIVNVHGGGFVAPLAVRGRQPFFSNASLVGTNARIRGSITTVSSEDFGRGNFSHRQFGVDERQWRDGRVMTANLPVVPSRENLRVSAEGRGGLPSSVQPRNVGHFYTQHQPPAAPESFHNQVEHMQRVVGSSDMRGGPGQVDRRDIGGAARGNERIGNTEVPRNDHPAGGSFGNDPRNEGNGRFNRPESGNSGSPGNDGNGNRGGWSKFSPPPNRTGGESGSKPPLELHRPIVTPRENSGPDTRNDRYSPPPRSDSGRYNPPPRSDSGRYSPPPRSDSGRYNPPSRSDSGRYSPPSRSESPRYSPPSRSEHSHSSSSHSGSGERGGHSDSKSSSSPRH